MADTSYRAQQVEVVCESPDVRVAEITLSPSANIPPHRHTHTQEICWCLVGQLTCQTPGEPSSVLQAGERKIFPINHEHTLRNDGDVPCRFLLVHGVGKFDFINSPPPTHASNS